MVQQFGVGVIEHPTAAAPQFMDGRGRIVLRTTRGTPPNAHRAAFLIVADHKAPITLGRTPTPTQKARWKAIQQARLKGLSLRAIAKELGIARDAVRKYACRITAHQ